MTEERLERLKEKYAATRVENKKEMQIGPRGGGNRMAAMGHGGKPKQRGPQKRTPRANPFALALGKGRLQKRR